MKSKHTPGLMAENVTTFLANLKHDIRNNESVDVGSGIFKRQELVDVANALSAFPVFMEALQDIERSGTFTGGTFVGELQHIAREAIAKAKRG